MAALRSGSYGSYYGSLSGTSEALSQSEMEVNATYIYSYLHSAGWSTYAIAGLLGNMQAESLLNPGRWQSEDVGNTSLGYGLVQWTPSTKYTNWCTSQGLTDPSQMDHNLARILYEVDNGLQWISTSTYPLSFLEFTTSTQSVHDLAAAFLLNYERPADQSQEVQNYRGSLASTWYTYITGQTPTPPTPGASTRRNHFNFVLFANKKRRLKK